MKKIGTEESLTENEERLAYCKAVCHKGIYHVKDDRGNCFQAPVAYATHYTFCRHLLKHINRKEYTELILFRARKEGDTVIEEHQ